MQYRSLDYGTGPICRAQDTLAQYMRVRVKNSGANPATVTIIGYGTAR